MLKGVTQEEYQEILSILKKYNAKFYAYGSRVRDDYTKSSDLDILVISDNYDCIYRDLKDDFNNSHIPYIVNFVDKNNISDEFYSFIQKDLVEFI